MGRLQPSPPPVPRLSSKRKVSGPSSQSKRRRSDENIQPADNVADAPTSSTHSFLPQFVTNGFRRLSNAWSSMRDDSPRDSASHGDPVSEATSPLASAEEEAEVASLVETSLAPTSLEPPSPVTQIDVGNIPVPSLVNAYDLERQISPAYELRGHIQLRLYLGSIRRQDLNRFSVLDRWDFDDLYKRYCKTRMLPIRYRELLPFQLFSSVITTHGETLAEVCI